MHPSVAPEPVRSLPAIPQGTTAGSGPGRAFSIRLLQEGDAAAWDKFVLGHPLGSPFHLTAWKKSIEETFHFLPLYLIAEDGDGVRGCVPLFLIKNLLVGRVLLSTPFAVYGGALAESPEVYDALKHQIHTLGEALAVDHVELRNAHREQRLGFSLVSRYVTFTQEIGAREDAILESIPRKTRYMVRKALKQGFETRVCPGPSAAFQELYDKSLRRLGTPSFPRPFFEALRRNFGQRMDVREVMLNGKVLSAVLSFYFRDQVLPYYGASAVEANALAPNNFMYYDLMRSAGAEGYSVFDFGRSKKTAGGSYDFKCHWGMVERDLPYEILLIRRKTLPNFSPTNPAFRWPVKVWQRLPLFITQKLGPLFLRLVP